MNEAGRARYDSAAPVKQSATRAQVCTASTGAGGARGKGSSQVSQHRVQRRVCFRWEMRVAQNDTACEIWGKWGKIGLFAYIVRNHTMGQPRDDWVDVVGLPPMEKAI